MHGDRFVGTRLILKKEGRAIMDKTVKKLGLSGIVSVSR
jgi:putative transposon-encoded protein